MRRVRCTCCTRSTLFQTHTEPNWPSGILECWEGWCQSCFERQKPGVKVTQESDFTKLDDTMKKLTDSLPDKLAALGRDVKGALVERGIPLDTARRIHVRYHEYLSCQKSRRKRADAGSYELEQITEIVVQERVACLLGPDAMSQIEEVGAGAQGYVIVDTAALAATVSTWFGMSSRPVAPSRGAHGRFVARRTGAKVVMPGEP